MKKILTLFVAFIFFGCGAKNLQKNFLVSEGMSKEEVIKIMGMPVASEFDRGVEEFHYCSTGMYVDNFVSFFFKDGKVVSKTTYNVNAADAGYSSGHCKLFVKRGNYRVPDKVVELRATIY